MLIGHITECVTTCREEWISATGAEPEVHYNDPLTGQLVCEECKFNNCAKCSENGCETCRDTDYFIVQGHCVNTCEMDDHYIAEDDEGHKQCLPCSTNCLKCHNADECLVCQEGEFKRYSPYAGRQICVITCPSETTTFITPEGENRCEKCIEIADGCEECHYTDNVNNKVLECIACSENYYRNQDTHECNPNCANGYANVQLGTTPTQLNECQRCKDLECDVCSFEYDKCLVCKDGYKKLGNICIQNCNQTMTPGHIITSVKETHNGILHVVYKCEPCQLPCLECNGTTDKCITCPTEMPILTDDGKCINKCADGFYLNNVGKCVQCTMQNCKKCTKDTCVIPIDPYCIVLGEKLPESEVILKMNCAKGWYKDPNTSVCNCKPCDEEITGCKQCGEDVSGLVCHKCHNGRYLDTVTKQCVELCPPGQFGRCSDNTCKECHESCARCYNDGPRCFKCNEGFNRHRANCVRDCPSGFFSTMSDDVHNIKYCEKCGVLNCATCSVKGTCGECEHGFRKTTKGKCVHIPTVVVEQWSDNTDDNNPKSHQFNCGTGSTEFNNIPSCDKSPIDISFQMHLTNSLPTHTAAKPEYIVWESKPANESSIKIRFSIELAQGRCKVTIFRGTDSAFVYIGTDGACNDDGLNDPEKGEISLKFSTIGGNIQIGGYMVNSAGRTDINEHVMAANENFYSFYF